MVDKKHDIDDENIIPVMLDKLTEEQKATLEQMMNQLQNQYLHSFTLTRHGTVIQRHKVTLPFDDEGASSPKDIMAIYHGLINQSGVLVNTLTNMIKTVVDGTIAEHQVKGPLHQMQQQLGGTPRQQPWVDMIANVMREQFGLKPKDGGNLYWHPYPEYFERVPLPNRYKVPDFSKFSGQDNVSTYEHVSRFSVQCGEASANDALKVRDMRNGCCILALTDSQLANLTFQGLLTPIKEIFLVQAFERRIKFDDPKKPMKIDGNPFTVNMVHTSGGAADWKSYQSGQFNFVRMISKYVTTGNKPTGIPYVRALILVPGGKTEPQTKPYPLDMWKYGSALQQRPEDRSLYGRG
uniref:Uncharacterized protein n=1 Tax=Oryza sativa subsp. japonica TaxID=39947 RepID=Q9AYC8_ORYSJ|nr:Hypothetical protein [Oryza sativa Japonica Group]